MILNNDCLFHIFTFLNYKDILIFGCSSKENRKNSLEYISPIACKLQKIIRNYSYNKKIRRNLKNKYSVELFRFRPFIIVNIIENGYFFRNKKNLKDFIILTIRLLKKKYHNLDYEQNTFIKNIMDKEKINYTDIKNILKVLNTNQLLRLI